MKVKIWLVSWLIIVISALSFFGFWVYKIDPFFHYHKPDLEKYYYTLNNQRSQNDGIVRHFDYDTIIAGTSMIENFRTTEINKIFDCTAIKVPFSGGRYKEINDNIARALKSNDDIRYVIRCLDMLDAYIIIDDEETMRNDLGNYPTYLYDDNLLNDTKYLLNKDIIFGRVYPMTLDNAKEGFQPGITSFDDYSRWQSISPFGMNTVIPGGLDDTNQEKEVHLTEDEKEIIKNNIEKNVIAIADNNPDVEFYYFYSPYSIVSWNDWKSSGLLYKHLEMEAYMTELIVPHKNIHLYSFNNRTDIITDLNNYKDPYHYASWINSLILKWMYEEQYRLTEDNYKNYLKQEYDFYTTFDYSSINSQEDYEADYYAAALLNKELTGAEPLAILDSDTIDSSANNSNYVPNNSIITFSVNLDDGYNYLSFNAQKIVDGETLAAYVYNKDGDLVGQFEANHSDLDNEMHQYVMDLSTVTGKVTVVLNGDHANYNDNSNSNYQFSNICIY